ncbi:hypothetical protein L21SP3_00468 [Sedimentisphaera cyanobacteriorum]|uniref:V-type ATP synthase subunit H n=1 Tax=Sedimentisphaera cyanobacteriorum TaxID=1940790 RepID=A0A1Q2HMC2_9BACT|nr:hypothetical protein [Sedimentisphaera cyanobacteriorum]AQQ08679.1 hypothetical protein L21SP3_00468 [Sedimentisphaera cyanobacteriorum]
MELIKKIKDAEKKAEEIEAKARADAEGEMKKAEAERKKKLSDAESSRKQKIDKAVKDARSEGYVEADAIDKNSKSQCSELENVSQSSVEAASDMLVNRVLSMADKQE